VDSKSEGFVEEDGVGATRLAKPVGPAEAPEGIEAGRGVEDDPTDRSFGAVAPRETVAPTGPVPVA